MKPIAVTMAKMLSNFSQLGALQQGKQIPGYVVVQSGFKLDVFVGTGFIEMYADCACIEISHQVFNRMSKKYVVSWNAMITGYGIHGHVKDAVACFL